MSNDHCTTQEKRFVAHLVDGDAEGAGDGLEQLRAGVERVFTRHALLCGKVARLLDKHDNLQCAVVKRARADSETMTGGE